MLGDLGVKLVMTKRSRDCVTQIHISLIKYLICLIYYGEYIHVLLITIQKY